jgi:hypothetical protein
LPVSVPPIRIKHLARDRRLNSVLIQLLTTSPRIQSINQSNNVYKNICIKQNRKKERERERLLKENILINISLF